MAHALLEHSNIVCQDEILALLSELQAEQRAMAARDRAAMQAFTGWGYAQGLQADKD